MIFGIAYHSPLDIISLVPNNVKIVLKSNNSSSGTVLFTKHKIKGIEGPQLVFASKRDLKKQSVPILDEGNNGKILNLKQIQWNSFLKGFEDE